jgi:hypothetical protein
MGLLTSSLTPPGNGYYFVQTTPNMTWVITHNLNVPNGPVIDVSVNYQGSLQRMIPSSIVATSANVTTVTFTAPYSGTARLV